MEIDSMEQTIRLKIAVFGQHNERCSEGYPNMCPKIAGIYADYGGGGPQIGSRCSVFGGELEKDAQGYYLRRPECTAAVIVA